MRREPCRDVDCRVLHFWCANKRCNKRHDLTREMVAALLTDRGFNYRCTCGRIRTLTRKWLKANT